MPRIPPLEMVLISVMATGSPCLSAAATHSLAASVKRCIAGNHLGIVDEEVESPDHVPVNARGERKERLHQGFCHDGMAEAGRFCIWPPYCFIGGMPANMKRTCSKVFI